MRFWQALKSSFAFGEEANPKEPGAERGARWARQGLRTSLLLGLLAILSYAASSALPRGSALLMTASLGLLVTGSSFLIGALLGFLFGIPRTLQQNLPPLAPEEPSSEMAGEGKVTRRQRIEYRGNTSLEQISDWLTKILVGLSLTQWPEIRAAFQNMVSYVALGFGDGPSREVFVGGTILLGSICGFFAGYLLTRLFLPLALTKSDIEGSRMIDELREEVDRQVETLRSTSPSMAQESTSQAPNVRDQIRAQLAALAHDYESLRATLPAGPDRTRKMEKIMSQMRTLAPMMDPGLRRELQNSPSPGQRLAAIACIQVHPDIGSLRWLAERVGSEKPFVGYHAALALFYAAQDPNIPSAELLLAIRRAKELLEPEDRISDRARMLDKAEQEALAQR
jgi:hypothetical protein